MENLMVGTRVFNSGDMANVEHFATITAKKVDRWGTHYELTPDAGSDREGAYWISSPSFSEVYKGNGSTRFVTEAAYRAWEAERRAEFNAWAGRMAAAK